MQTVTIYDSMHNERGIPKPIQHLQCNLTLHDVSYKLLQDAKIVTFKSKLPNLVCVLDELPNVSFSSNWSEGCTTTSMGPLDKLLNDSMAGTFVKAFASSNFISTTHTNEYSQHIMSEGSTMSLSLKFRIYADTYNQRYRFMTSTYESWLKALSFAVTPLIPMTYGNVATNFNAAIGNAVNEFPEAYTNITNVLSSAGQTAMSLIDDTSNSTKEATKKLVQDIKALTDEITQLGTQANTFGHITFDIEIPGYLHPTKSTATPVYWIVKSFTATPCAQFLRGIAQTVSEEESQIATSYENAKFRPKPLYFDFDVTLETNQNVTREQYLAMLVKDKSIKERATQN